MERTGSPLGYVNRFDRPDQGKGNYRREETGCFRCGRPLTPDEVGLYRKMVRRNADRFLCISCLGEHFQCPEELLREKIELFRSMGCTLFPKKASRTEDSETC